MQIFTRWTNRFILMISLLISSISYADDAPLNQLMNHLQNLTTMSSSFKQDLYDPKGKKIQTSKGEMYFSRPGKFRWETQKPDQQRIIADGDKIWIYDIDLKQVTINQAQKTMSETPAALLSGKISTIAEQFKVELLDYDTEEGQEIYQLRAKKQDADFPVITLEFKKDILVRMDLNDHLNQRTHVSFEKVQVNPPLKPSLFAFAPPPGVDIIDNTQKVRTSHRG